MDSFILQVLRAMLDDVNGGKTAEHPAIVDINECAFQRVEQALRERTPEAFAAALTVGFTRVLENGDPVNVESMTQFARMVLATMVVNQSMGAQSNRPCP